MDNTQKLQQLQQLSKQWLTIAQKHNLHTKDESWAKKHQTIVNAYKLATKAHSLSSIPVDEDTPPSKSTAPIEDLPIKHSVGYKGKNNREDVLIVQKQLNKYGYNLPEDGEHTKDLDKAIRDFQMKRAGVATEGADATIEPKGHTWKCLKTGQTYPPNTIKPRNIHDPNPIQFQEAEQTEPLTFEQKYKPTDLPKSGNLKFELKKRPAAIRVYAFFENGDYTTIESYDFPELKEGAPRMTNKGYFPNIDEFRGYNGITVNIYDEYNNFLAHQNYYVYEGSPKVHISLTWPGSTLTPEEREAEYKAKYPLQYGIISAFRTYNPVFKIVDNAAFDYDIISGKERTGSERILGIVEGATDLITLGKGGGTAKILIPFVVEKSPDFLVDNELIEEGGVVDQSLRFTTKVFEYEIDLTKGAWQNVQKMLKAEAGEYTQDQINEAFAKALGVDKNLTSGFKDFFDAISNE